MKKIAVIMESWMRCFTYAWPSGMLTKIKESGADVNLYIFNSSANWSEDEKYNMGEYNIFRLPNLAEYDGIVLDLNNITKQEIRDYVLEKARESKVPTIVISNQFEGFYSVGIDNYKAMRDIISHLYEHHGNRTFWFIMGPEDNYENRRRVEALKHYIKEKGIMDEDCAFYYGDFDFNCGVNGFEYLKHQKDNLPDAVVCANDNIAVGVLTAAEKYGFKAPEDFLVTGFDDLDKSRYFDPRISTISYTREDIGYVCMEMFFEIWGGGQAEPIRYTRTTPVFWESCGCTSEIVIDVRKHLKEHILYNIETTAFEEHILALKHKLLHCSTVQEMLDCIPQSIPSLKCDAMYLVMDRHLQDLPDENMLNGDVDMDTEEEPFIVEGYPENMTIAFSYENDLIEDFDRENAVIKGIFPMFDCEEKGVNFLFLPLHFRDKCVGYFAIRNAIYLMEKQFLFEIINALTNALERLYAQSKLAKMNCALSSLYNRDSMTMLYNRLCMEKYSEQFLKKKHAQGKPVCFIYIDLDRLKYINDNFGHEMGDFAIKEVAEVIRKHSSDDALAFRLGGDEFLLVDSFEGEEATDKRCRQMQESLAEAGKAKRCPFELSLSYGYVASQPGSSTGIDEYIKRADDIMYQYKSARKMNRKD